MPRLPRTSSASVIMTSLWMPESDPFLPHPPGRFTFSRSKLTSSTHGCRSSPAAGSAFSKLYLRPPTSFARIPSSPRISSKNSPGFGVFSRCRRTSRRSVFDRPSAVPGPFRDITIRVSEESSEESLRPLLESLSDTPVSASSPQPGQMTYSASLAELDVQTLIHIDRVFEIAPLGHATISSERQAQLIGQPGSVTGNGATLPPSNPFPPDGKTYLQWLSDHGLGITANTFDNTTVGLIDTGFDNGDISYDGIHPDFKYSNGGDQTVVVDGTIRWGSFQDNDWHGTLTASVVAGYPASDRVDAAGYRWGLGVAPTVRLIVDRWLRCQVRDGTFSENVGDITGKGVNVVNASVNIGNSEGGCAYALGYSNVIDQYTASGWLFTLSAGNSTPDGCPGNYVRAPATAKNGLTVGSTDNFTLAWPNNRTDGICAWCDYAPDHSVSQDARRIPSYSAVRDPSSLVKPDLVAPSTRVTGPVSRSGSCQ